MIKTGMDKHMQALKAVTFKQSGAAPAKSVTSKLQAVVDKLQAKVDAELADPSNAHNPIVGIDVQMLKAMKTAVAKSDALVAAAQQYTKKHPDKKAAVARALKVSLG